jgi:hypothetical protein
VISHVVTLNFDLALSNGLTDVGPTEVAIISGPHDHSRLATTNAVYLHGNVESDPESWILRTATLVVNPTSDWIRMIVARVCSGPVTVFVGLGNPAGVFVESVRIIATMVRAVPGARLYQVGPGHFGSSPFTAVLEATQNEYIRMEWGEFMGALAARLVLEQRRELHEVCNRLTDANGWPPENSLDLCERITRLGLLRFGVLRARWLLDSRGYKPWRQTEKDWVADVILVIGLIERTTGVQAQFEETGVVRFCRGSATVVVAIVAHGRGSERWLSLEQRIHRLRRNLSYLSPGPQIGLVGGIAGGPQHASAPPVDIVTGGEPDSIVTIEREFLIVTTDEIRADPQIWIRMTS